MTVTTHRAAEAGTAELPEFEEGPRRRLSFVRILLAIVLLGGAAYGISLIVRNRINLLGPVSGTWFAPYIDVTNTPTYQFQLPANNTARQSVLGFVVSEPGAACTPSWGGAYTLEQANGALNLDSRVAQIRANGATPIVSFGGQKNTSLQVGCTDQAALNAAFLSVITTYQLHTVDLDVEGSALDNAGANQRLAEAMKAIQSTPGHTHLAVWLTVPVETNGLQANAQSLVSTMLRDHVSLAGVNIMAMDFSQTTSNLDMLSAAESALVSTHVQLAQMFGSYGIHLHSRVLWNHMGVTVMIGQNNYANQVFTLSDAHGLEVYAHQVGLARVSFWSLNRDEQCGSGFGETGVLSTTCSGVPQATLAFSDALAGLTGTVPSGAGHSSGLVTAVRPDLNPADSPYPQWNGAEAYVAGYKVVREGFIYEAKWYNQGDDPAVPTQFEWETPWLMIGPVLPGSHPPTLPTLPLGTYPNWSVSVMYTAGEKVLFNQLPYQAKWDTEGASPGAEAADPSASPWQPLFTIPGEPSDSA